MSAFFCICLKHSVSLSHHIACRETLKELRTAEFLGLGRFFVKEFPHFKNSSYLCPVQSS